MATELRGDVTSMMFEGMVHTKVHAPVSRRLVPRDALFETLKAHSGAKLTLICGPVGWGKSSLLAGWATVDEFNRPFAWFAVDEADNDPVKFWSYVVEALRAVEPSIGTVSLALLHAPGTDLTSLVMTELINELGTVNTPLVLAIDDYQLINNPEIHTSLAFFVEHLPKIIHVAIATRAKPQLPIAKLRARGQLIEIDAAALRFSDAETERFLNELLDLGLSHTDVLTLQERTEGWAAGLYLAALSLRARPDPHEFITQFAGDDRHIVDYLGAEVLASQDSPLRTFLLRTSILERLCAPLCDAVTGTPSSGRSLREIEQSNLFLLPLDTKREWYRYHHLFRDLLRRQLQTTEASLIPHLHRRAAHWLLQAGHVSEAVHHTIAAGDHQQACELIAAHWTRFLGVGNHAAIVSWLEALPEHALLADARVCAAGALVSLSTNHLEQTEPWLEKAERAAIPGPFMDGYGSLESTTACARAGHSLGIGSLSETRTSVMEALSMLEETSPWRPVWLFVFGMSSYLLGNTQESLEALEESLRLGRLSGVEIGVVLTLGALASVRADLGQWDQASELASEAQAIGSGQMRREHWAYGFSHFVRGRVLAHYGEFEAAEANLRRGTELIRRGLRVFIAYLLPSFATFKHDRNDRDEASKLIREAQSVVKTFPDPGILPELIDKVERRLSHAPASPPTPSVEKLSARELSVLRLLTTTLSQRDIARELYVSMNTVKSHAKSIFRKLGVSTRAEAVTRARQLELI